MFKVFSAMSSKTFMKKQFFKIVLKNGFQLFLAKNFCLKTYVQCKSF